MKKLIPSLAIAALMLLLVPGAALYYSYSGGDGCARCHEIAPTVNTWRASAHRNVACASCHGGSFAADNVRRVVAHARGDVPGQVRLRIRHVKEMMARCQSCHRQEFAQWQAGPHSSTYTRIFLDKEHNRKRRLMDDCLRCHGTHFEGGIQELVAPLDTQGPWRLAAGVGDLPVMPCMSCHEMHREGAPLVKPLKPETYRPSLALFDRRDMAHVGIRELPLPVMFEGTRRVKMSPDGRQALCYQCHAPLAEAQVRSGDDRTPIGVHEGLSCLACHAKHGQQARASCAGCHPRWSNCGLDVEKMDTTFKDAKSKHDIHFVKCGDCHPKGVPKKREALRLAVD